MKTKNIEIDVLFKIQLSIGLAIKNVISFWHF